MDSPTPYPAANSTSFPHVKTVARKWINAAFVSSMVSFAIICALTIGGFFYLSSLAKEYGVEIGIDRINMVFSDGSSVDLSSEEFLEQDEFHGTELQYKEFSDRQEQLYDNYIETKAWMKPLIILGLAALLAALLYLPLYIVLLILIYKGWKTLQPLKKLVPEETSLMPRPIVALVLCFIPFINFLWAYICLPGFAFYGKKLAPLRDKTYQGPSMAFGMIIAIWLSIDALFQAFSNFYILPIPWWTYTVLGVFFALVSVILLFLFCRRLSVMVEDFGKNQ